jgi:RNA polymerase sigma factor (sigma-70 family)
MANDNNKYSTGTAGFLQIYEEYMAYIYRYINYRIGNSTVTADLTSAVFEKALAAYGSYRQEKAAPQTWLIAIARNTVTDYLRQFMNRNTVPIEAALEVASKDPTPEEQLERKEEQDLLRMCMSLLSYHEQEVISLKFGAELTNRSIADQMGTSGSNIGVILFRAIIKLRDCVTKSHRDGK